MMLDSIFEDLKTLASQKGWKVEGGATGVIDLVRGNKFVKFDHTFESAACTLALEWLKKQDTSVDNSQKTRRQNGKSSSKTDSKNRGKRD